MDESIRYHSSKSGGEQLSFKNFGSKRLRGTTKEGLDIDGEGEKEQIEAKDGLDDCQSTMSNDLEEKRGYLPVGIKIVPEGAVGPHKNVLFTLEDADDRCCWLTDNLDGDGVDINSLEMTYKMTTEADKGDVRIVL